jgi:site-specific recombinase XerD
MTKPEEAGNPLAGALVPAAPASQSLRWEQVTALVVDALPSPHSKRVYARALAEFADWAREQPAGPGTEGFSKALVQRYRSRLESKGLAPSSVNVALTAIRKLATEAADGGLLDPDTAAAIGRVKGAAQKGRRLGRWLTREEAGLLLRDRETESLKGKRDRAILCLLVGAGLRREELAGLTVDHLQQREGRWVIADLVGKRKRLRTIPIPAWAKVAVDRWTAAAGIAAGSLFRAVDKGGRLAESLSAQAVYLIVTRAAGEHGVPLAPHDLRRTFARLAHQGKVPLEQIQLSLGHDSIQTTEKYLGIRQDLRDAPCDHLGIEVEY